MCPNSIKAGQIVVYADDAERYRAGDTMIPVGRVVKIVSTSLGGDIALVRWFGSRYPYNGEKFEVVDCLIATFELEEETT
jgi:hypothetical protein